VWRLLAAYVPSTAIVWLVGLNGGATALCMLDDSWRMLSISRQTIINYSFDIFNTLRILDFRSSVHVGGTVVYSIVIDANELG